jgi:hypothetical protein
MTDRRPIIAAQSMPALAASSARGIQTVRIRSRRHFRFSLRTLLLLVSISCAACGLAGQRLLEIRRQHSAATKLEQLGATVYYDHSCLPGDALVRAVSFSPALNSDIKEIHDTDLVPLIALTNLRSLSLCGQPITDEGLAYLANLRNLAFLSLRNTNVTDRGLIHLYALDRLLWLDLRGTRVTEKGLAHLDQLDHLVRMSLAGEAPTFFRKRDQ